MSENGMPNQNSGCSESYNEYLKRAIDACEAGDLVLGMHLYLAAYEKSVVDPAIPDGMALSGLREAWRLACDLKERSMAEYVFEKLEPYLTGDEIAECAQQLQNLALDRLEQYGFSREELEDMAEMISQDFAGDGSVVKVESISIPHMGMFGVPATVQASPDAELAGVADGTQDAQGEPDEEQALEAQAEQALYAVEGDEAAEEADFEGALDEGRFEPTTAAKKSGKPFQVGMAAAPVDGFNPYSYYEDYSIGKSYHAATNEGTGAHVFSRDVARLEAGEKFKAEQAERVAQAGEGHTPEKTPTASANEKPEALEAKAQGGSDGTASKKQLAKSGQGASGKAKTSRPAEAGVGVLDYRQLVGFDEAVSVMRDFGIGLHADAEYLDFVAMMNQRHGIDRAPALDTMLFRAPVIEDAARFAEATIGEIGLPVLRMSMEEGIQGAPMLCVTTNGNHRPRMNHAHNRFEAPAILVIEDLDAWIVPQPPENMEGVNGFVMANISRGAREAVNMIRSAVEDPDVFVLATATTSGEVDPFFYEMLEPLTVIDIGYPNDKERADIWTEIARDHPSMRMINRADLMRYSEGLPRYDIYMAAREALEEAYKVGLVQRGYVPVTPQNIFEKLAACQPLDSDAYRALEDEVIRNFQDDLAHLEDLVNGTWE